MREFSNIYYVNNENIQVYILHSFHINIGCISKVTHDYFFGTLDKDKNLRIDECFYFSHRSFKYSVNYVCMAIGLTWLLPPRRIKIRDKLTINKARTHNSSGIKTRLLVYRKLNLSLRI